MCDATHSLREMRDRLLGILYELGQGRPFFAADGREAQSRFGGTRQQFDAALNVLMSQDCIEARVGPVGTIPLSDEGQRQAERLLPSAALRDPPSPAVVQIGTNYGIVQGGSGNTQTVNIQIDNSQVSAVLSKIESELDRLPLAPTVREEAKGHVQSLREAITHRLPAAGLRAIGAGLAGVLTEAGSHLGHALMDALKAQVA